MGNRARLWRGLDRGTWLDLAPWRRGGREELAAVARTATRRPVRRLHRSQGLAETTQAAVAGGDRRRTCLAGRGDGSCLRARKAGRQGSGPRVGPGRRQATLVAELCGSFYQEPLCDVARQGRQVDARGGRRPLVHAGDRQHLLRLGRPKRQAALAARFRQAVHQPLDALLRHGRFTAGDAGPGRGLRGRAGSRRWWRWTRPAAGPAGNIPATAPPTPRRSWPTSRARRRSSRNRRPPASASRPPTARGSGRSPSLRPMTRTLSHPSCWAIGSSSRGSTRGPSPTGSRSVKAAGRPWRSGTTKRSRCT